MGAERCVLTTSDLSPWSSPRLHPPMDGKYPRRRSDDLTQLRMDPKAKSRAVPPLVAEETTRGKKKNKQHEDCFACETIRLYFLSGKTQYCVQSVKETRFIKTQTFKNFSEIEKNQKGKVEAHGVCFYPETKQRKGDEGRTWFNTLQVSVLAHPTAP